MLKACWIREEFIVMCLFFGSFLPFPFLCSDKCHITLWLTEPRTSPLMSENWERTYTLDSIFRFMRCRSTNSPRGRWTRFSLRNNQKISFASHFISNLELAGKCGLAKLSYNRIARAPLFLGPTRGRKKSDRRKQAENWKKVRTVKASFCLIWCFISRKSSHLPSGLRFQRSIVNRGLFSRMNQFEKSSTPHHDAIWTENWAPHRGADISRPNMLGGFSTHNSIFRDVFTSKEFCFPIV